jgi:hypothetical protein
MVFCNAQFTLIVSFERRECYFHGLMFIHDSRKGDLESLSQLLPVSRFLDWCQSSWPGSDYIGKGDQYDPNSHAARQDC